MKSKEQEMKQRRRSDEEERSHNKEFIDLDEKKKER